MLRECRILGHMYVGPMHSDGVFLWGTNCQGSGDVLTGFAFTAKAGPCPI